MRIIKFRCWNKQWEGFRHGCNIIGYDGKIGHDVSTGILWQSAENLDNYVVQQFTGLFDKNGKEIFEGDVIKSVINGIAIIEYDEYRGGYVIRNKKNGGCFNLIFDFSKEIEIIGNIFENPELKE